MRFLFFIAGAALLAVTLFSADDWKLPSGEPQLKRGPGAEVAVGNCVICHSADYISMQPSMDAAGWKAIVVKMREKYGAPLPPEQVEPVVNYLVSQYGKK